ncbi:MAG TPA: c-type cytochrome [Bryobacteraceae bacterium]|nr:c-type cytochrome [Bryobacteraceae bacterium]
MSRLLQTGAGVIIFAAGIVPLPAQPPPAQPPRPGRSFLISRDVPDPAGVERGQKIFVARCGFCHGSNANGGESGPDLVRSVLALDDEGGDKIGPVIRNGRPDKGMPAFPLTDDQIKDVGAFLRSRQQAAINRNAYTIQNIVTGDAKKGQAYFNGAGRCNTCHSPTGDLGGIANKYDPVALQSRLVYPRTQRPRRAEGPEPKVIPTPVTVTLASGQTVTGTLEYIDDFDVALRDASGDYRSFTRDAGVKVDVRDPLAAHEELLKKYTDEEMHNLVAYLETLK